jgi:hypothetical protein
MKSATGTAVTTAADNSDFMNPRLCIFFYHHSSKFAPVFTSAAQITPVSIGHRGLFFNDSKHIGFDFARPDASTTPSTFI